ncbi:MAG: hypothetical protein ACI9CP_001970, partial [Cryomorphaceae bacterium]
KTEKEIENTWLWWFFVKLNRVECSMSDSIRIAKPKHLIVVIPQ